ncbi:hypothetical protein [Microbacterium karelineae]|uniref:hypothetical protein n=1 Tax=Microbacterium karelineae TaxID=2654283 RepID=UPI0012EABEAA|nr:hypothetical protein [Microbacterium karelineae]
MIALRYALLVFAGVCFGVVGVTGIVNGVALLGLIALGGAAWTSRALRVWLGLADEPDPASDVDEHAGACPCRVDHAEAGFDADRLDRRR